MKKKLIPILIIIVAIAIIYNFYKNDENDEWHYSNGTPIVCRVNGCGKTPLHSNWDDRFCEEHLNKSENHSNEYTPSVAKKKVNTKRALTKEEADAVRGTGFQGTRPNSVAEDMKIKALMVKCANCGMHSDNGSNSICDECQYNKDYGLE